MENGYGEGIRIDVKGGKLSNPFDKFKSLNAIQKCIVAFIEEYNSKGFTLGEDFSFYIIYHSVRDLYSGNEYKFGQEYLKNENKDKLPIIHLTLFDIFAPPTFLSGDHTIKLPEVKRYNKIVDSSIWNHYVPLFATDSFGNCATKIDYKRFHHVLQDVASNTAKGLYNLSVADEYADLNARLLEQSHLKGSHKAISPFIFHSENELKDLIYEEFEDRVGQENESIVSLIKKHRWRILLVDDKAEGDMSIIKKIPSGKDANNLPLNSKLSIIISLLEEHFVDSDHTICRKGGPISDKCIFYIDYVKDLDSAKKALKNQEYDLILLDYLLDNQEYGYELLDDIYKHIDIIDPLVDDLRKHYNNIKNLETEKKQEEIANIFRNMHRRDSKYKELLYYIEQNEYLSLIYQGDSELEEKLNKLFSGLRKYKVGPCGRYFFMFISAYSSAVHERLLAEGLNQSEKFWFINVGACPTNTPQLFLYNLIKLMDKRIHDSHIRKLSVDGITGVLSKIYEDKDHVRKNAGEYYQDVQSYQYYYREILKDYKVLDNKESVFDTKGSVLMTDFMNSKINLGGLLEHMAQLVHLTAFGTVRQWPEMWEEYIYTKSLLESQMKVELKKEDKEENKNEFKAKFKTLCDNIQDYILDLKSAAI